MLTREALRGGKEKLRERLTSAARHGMKEGNG